MDHPPLDMDALEAEVAALVAEDLAQTARIDALLRRGSIEGRLADCRVLSRVADRELAAQERYQRRITRALQEPL